MSLRTAISALFFASLLGAPAQSQGIPDGVSGGSALGQLFAKEEVANDRCRGGSGDDPKTEQFCAERDQYMRQLNERGWCYGKADEIAADNKWHRCGPDSLRIPTAEAEPPVQAKPQGNISQGPEWLVGPSSQLAAIWANTPSLDYPTQAMLHPALCEHFRWREWGGQTCGHGVSLMLGDLAARAKLCGKPEGHSPAIFSLVAPAAYGLHTRQGDVGNVMDAFYAQNFKVEGFLLNSPALRLDCQRVAEQAVRIERFLIGYKYQTIEQLAPNLPPILREQTFPDDGGDGTPSLWEAQAGTLFRQQVPESALLARRDMARRIDEAVVNYLSTSLNVARKPPVSDLNGAQYLYDLTNHDESITRRPAKITIRVEPKDGRIVKVFGRTWQEVWLPSRTGGVTLVYIMVWQGGEDLCYVRFHANINFRAPGILNKRMECDDFLGKTGMSIFDGMVGHL